MILQYFPCPPARDKQIKALETIEKAISLGFKDIVLSAPTGVGKSFAGVAAAYFQRSAYYLVTQKLLQDQLEHDFKNTFDPAFRNGVSLKTAAEYPCPNFGNCGVPSQTGKKCSCQACPYKAVKSAFMGATVGVTNYAYFFTERINRGEFMPREILICDEAHNLEREIIRHVDLEISEKYAKEKNILVDEFPNIPEKERFIAWVKEKYLPAADETAASLVEMAEGNIDKSKDAYDMMRHVSKIRYALTNMDTEWVYWQDMDEKKNKVYTARPLYARKFVPFFIQQMGKVRLYMSAFMGTKETFCHALGLDPEETCWIGLGSPFEIKNRKNVFAPSGSMSKRNIAKTFPRFVADTREIMDRHANEKGIIHCGSYLIGSAIHKELCKTHRDRILFPKSADDRQTLFDQHVKSEEPTVIISPSMAEGYDFKHDLARWQIIAKVPFASLFDKQVEARKDADPDWYVMQAVMLIIQASGRICRSETDYGTTYILDADFGRILSQNKHLFPKWWIKALVRD